MANEKKFLVIKNKDEKTIKYFEYSKLNGYNITPKNNVKFEDAINVSRMILINPSLIEKLIDKKVQRKLTSLINMMAIVCDEADESGDGLYLALDEVTKFKNEVFNKYRSYISEEKLALIEKKIAILEDELKLRIKYLSYDYDMEEDYERGRKGK